MEELFLILVAVGILVALLLCFFLLWRTTRHFGGKVEDIVKPPTLAGVLASNRLLSDLVLLLEGQIQGPESLLVEGRVIYTGTSDGKIVKIIDGHVDKYLKLVESRGKAGTYSSEPKTGRPLGIRRLKDEYLVVVDAYFGVFKVAFEKGTVTKLYDAKVKVGGHTSKFLNDVEVLDENTIVVTDSSTNYHRRDFTNAILENAPNGRVLKIDATSGETCVLIDGLHFANGIQLHPDKESLLIAETSMFRIRRYFFKGPRQGQLVVFAENLPGFPDNIRMSMESTRLYVAMCTVRSDSKPSAVDQLNRWPLLRRLIVTFVPNRLLNSLSSMFAPKYGLFLVLDFEGHILRSYHDPDGKVDMLSQASDDADFIFLGSPQNRFIAQVPKTV